MKILLLSNMYPSKAQPTYGIFVKNFVDQMTGCGVTIEKVVIEGRGYGLATKLSRYWCFFWCAVRSLGKADYDLVYVHYIGHSLLPLLIKRPRRDRPLIVNAHGGDVFPRGNISRVIKILGRRVVRSAKLVVVPSRYFLDVISSDYSLPKDRIFISPSGGVDSALFFPVNSKTKPRIPTVGYVSRIDSGKGWATLLPAMAKFVQAGSTDIRCVVIGGGSEVDEFSRMVDRLDLGSCVEYLGAIPHDELPQYYNDMDVLVFPTERDAESLGLVGLEALACGVPVIGSAIAALPGYIEHGRNGFLFPPGDSDALFSCLVHFFSLKEAEIYELKRNATRSVEDYDSTSVGYALKGKLQEVMAE